jgi:flagellar P-ring protein precursor FlgI
MGPDQRSYALAQGSLVVGGHRFESEANLRQRNYPTSGTVPGGATVEAGVTSDLLRGGNELTFVLREADATTASRIADGINQMMGRGAARVRGADAVVIDARAGAADIHRLVAGIENVRVTPAIAARVVINERTGTVVAGEEVRIASVVVSQGDVEVTVRADHEASQPYYSFGRGGAESLIVTNTRLDVERDRDAVVQLPSTSVGDLVQALHRARVNTRGIIAVLQAVKAAGALHAEIIVQ